MKEGLPRRETPRVFCHFRPDGKIDERWKRIDEVGLRMQLGILQPGAVGRA